jgi:hypothetical protein
VSDIIHEIERSTLENLCGIHKKVWVWQTRGDYCRQAGAFRGSPVPLEPVASHEAVAIEGRFGPARGLCQALRWWGLGGGIAPVRLC